MTIIDAWKEAKKSGKSYPQINRVSMPGKLNLDVGDDIARAFTYFIKDYGMKEDDFLADDWTVVGL